MNDLIRSIYRSYKPYKTSPQDYDVILNANENPVNLLAQLPQEKLEKLIKEVQYNRYPESDNTQLRKTYAEYIGKKPENIIAGVGSDEIIRMIADLFIENGDCGVACVPTFSMYKQLIQTAKGFFIDVDPRDESLEPDIDTLITAANENNAKLIFICTPNNPTGYLWKKDDIISVIENTKAMVIIDEAYTDFAEDNNLDLIDTYSRVIVLRTLSKAFGLAGARVGFAVASEQTIDFLNLVKVPYNLNVFSQCAAQLVLENIDVVKKQIAYLKSERDFMIGHLQRHREIKVYPTSANFILITTPKAAELFNKAERAKISLRNFSAEISDTLRISVGSREENLKLITIIEEVFS